MIALVILPVPYKFFFFNTRLTPLGKSFDWFVPEAGDLYW